MLQEKKTPEDLKTALSNLSISPTTGEAVIHCSHPTLQYTATISCLRKNGIQNNVEDTLLSSLHSVMNELFNHPQPASHSLFHQPS